ncbi:hypothetical protein ACTFIR_003953 [Dictyostelium discoideum]
MTSAPADVHEIQEYEEFLTEIQVVSFQEEKNLEEAEKFLQENSAKKGIYLFENGKLQVLVETPGSGNDILTDGAMPVILYNGSYLNGTDFGSSKEPFPISLELYPDSKQVLGMKIGESLYIQTLDPIHQVQGDVEGEDYHYDNSEDDYLADDDENSDSELDLEQ